MELLTDTNSLDFRLSKVSLIAMDVDGVLTDGTLQFASDGTESKRFHVADGLGIRLAILSGKEVAWISGRTSEAVERRAAELGVHHLFQGIRDKSVVLADICNHSTNLRGIVAYMGDDLNDLTAFEFADITFAPANAVTQMKDRADIVTEHSGGAGAVREMCDTILRSQKILDLAVSKYLEQLRHTS